ncbi:sugar ABC transporter ATP-binding protein [bacterium]|nr:MAG: sugar ABC transporter ATP-binding protein [bacterium]
MSSVDPARQVPLLELKGISKRFGAVEALVGVDFEAYRGEVVALVGDNGAGKSTLIKVISGINTPDAGEFRFEGRPVSARGPHEMAQLGIATVYQDLALCDNLDVVANLFLGREARRGVTRLLDEVTMEQRAFGVLKNLSIKIPSLRKPVATLSGGQRQAVAVARSIMWQTHLVLLDEPTAALGVAQTKQVLELIGHLREQGLGVVVISHNLADVFEVCDRIVVLRLGRRVADFKVREASREQVVSAITGADVAPLLAKASG